MNQAEAERAVATARAAGEADAFRDVASAAPWPALHDQDVYHETLSRILSGQSKLILDPGVNRPRHLIVPELPNDAATAATLVGPPSPRSSTSPHAETRP